MLINLTPHEICFNNGFSVKPSGTIARVAMNHILTGDYNGIDCFTATFGEVINLPEPQFDITYIVSMIVLDAAKALGRSDCCTPATGHMLCKRDKWGSILSVPGLRF